MSRLTGASLRRAGCELARTIRILRIMEHLRARRTAITVPALADAFEVSDRQIRRDLGVIRAADIPLESSPGRGGGVRLARVYFERA